MSMYEGRKTNFFILRESEQGEERICRINDWDSSIYWTDDLPTATAYKRESDARKMVEVQKMLSQILGKSYSFSVLKQDEVREILDKKAQEDTSETDKKAEE